MVTLVYRVSRERVYHREESLSLEPKAYKSLPFVKRVYPSSGGGVPHSVSRGS